MKRNYEDYLTKLLSDSREKESGLNDAETEKQFLKEMQKKDNAKSLFFCLIISLSYIFVISLCILDNFFERVYSRYIMIGGLLTEILLYNFSKFYTERFLMNKVIKSFRFFICYLGFMLPIVFAIKLDVNMVLRIYFIIFFYLNSIFMFFLDFNYVSIPLISLINFIILIYVQVIYNIDKYCLVPELLVNFSFYSSLFIIKKGEFSCHKKVFIETFNNLQILKYFSKLYDGISSQVICLSKNKILYINDYTLKYFNQYFSIINPQITNEAKENEIFLKNDNLNEKEIDIKIHLFFKEIQLFYPSSDFKKYEGKNLKEIIDEINLEDKGESNLFINLGTFTNQTNTNLSYEISIRKLFLNEEIVEILINYNAHSLSQFDNKQDIKKERKLFAKVVHEFKTPLLVILSLIDKILNIQKDVGNNLCKREFNNLQNMSNYTLFLINDIITFSNKISENVLKNEVNIKEIIEFSYSILETLICCNEEKIDLVKTSVSIDEDLNNIIVISDENRLKQILLNFISNAVKFTVSGYIKVKAKLVKDQNIVEISVKDSGIGIRDEDQHLLFHDYTMLGVCKKYNSRGSGLGLSICKRLAETLDHKVEFTSSYGKGSKFYLRIFFDQKNRNKKKTKTFSFFDTVKNEKIKRDSNFSHFNRCELILSDLMRPVDEGKSKDYQKIHNSPPLEIVDTGSKKTTRRNFDFFKLNNLDEMREVDSSELDNNKKITKKSFSLNIKNIINKKYDIVIVDDQKLVRDYTLILVKNVLALLEISDYNLIQANDGIELLNMVRLDKENKIKLIFVDEEMQYMNGSEAVRIIRKLEESQKIKRYEIISVSAFDDEEMKNKIMISGVDGIISKPCKKSELLKILCNLE